MTTAVASDFATNLNAQFQRITALHPQLLDAVPPEPVERRDGTYCLKPAEVFAEFCSREWQPRTGDDRNLVGPFVAYGECLSPFDVPGNVHYYDPTLPARDGDVVLVQWAPEVLEAMYARNAGSTAWMAQYGEPCPVATKIYKVLGCGSQYLLTRKSAIPLGENRILGVLRKRVEGGEGVSAERVSLIEAFAATEAYQISDLPETSYGNGSHFVVDGTFTPNVDSIVELTASYDFRGLPVDGLGNAMTRRLFVLQNSSYSYGVLAQNGAGTSTWISQPHSDFFNVVGGALVTFGLLLENASGTEVMRIRNARMKAGVLKR